MSATPIPGPWKVEPAPEDLNARVYGPRNTLVAVIWSGNARSLEVAVANANAIAAVPDLIAALQGMVDAGEEVFRSTGWPARFHNGTLTKARAALAKVKGGAA